MLMIMLTNYDDIDVKYEIAVGLNFLKLNFFLKKERNPLTLNTLISLDSAAVGLLCFTKWKLSIGNIKAFQQEYNKCIKDGFNTNVGPAARGKWLLCLCQVAAEGSFRLSLMEHSHNEEEKMRKKKEKRNF